MVTGSELPPAITEERFTRLVVEFANSGQLTDVLLRIPGIRLLAELASFTGRAVPGRIRGHLPTPELDALRERLRDDLTAIIHDDIDGRNLRRLASAAAKTDINPRYEIDPHGKLIARLIYKHESPAAAIAYGTLLMADEGRPFRRDLKQCQLKGCGLFFFASDSPAQTGRNRSRFCTPEHMHEHHKSTGAERVRRHRERQARKQK
jgi:hypothetical protein